MFVSNHPTGTRPAEPCGDENVRHLRRWRGIGAGLRHVGRDAFAATLGRVWPRPGTYSAWIRSFDKLSRPDVAEIGEHIRGLTRRPLISIIVPVDTDDARLVTELLASLEAQLYPEWEACLGVGSADAAIAAAAIDEPNRHRIRIVEAAGAGTTAALANSALSVAGGELLLLLRARDKLAPHALYMLAVELEACPDAGLIFSDEDVLDAWGRRRDPAFKTDWNPDLMLSHDMIGRLAAYRRGLVEQLGGWREEFGGAEEYDLALRASEELQPRQIRHIPFILYHGRRIAPTTSAQGGTIARPEVCMAMCRAVREHLDRTGTRATASALNTGRVRVHFPVPEPEPGVSLIVPTQDRVDLLRRCVGGLLEKTDYGAIEVLIIDNESQQPETLKYLRQISGEPRVRTVRCPGPFNYSAINNFAVRHAHHGIIGLLNNDVEVIHPDWLREMVSHAIRPEVGAVGAKLYYPDDRIQHAGTIVGLGGAAGHAFRFFKRNEAGYLGRMTVVQNLSAVTAACMLLRKEVFEAAGGLDEVNLAVAYNDVDLCLRIRELGLRIIWTPFAELYHWESASRASDFATAEIGRFQRERAYFQQRWAGVVDHDPYYSPNLSLDSADFSLAFPPRVSRPWRRIRPNRNRSVKS